MFCSTRGASGFTFQHCLFRGLAEDGGMFMPQSIPVVTRDTLLGWRDLSFPDLAVEVLSLFVSDAEIPRVDLSSILHKSFTKFMAKDVVPVVPLSTPPVNVVELWHGPTLAFKDIGLQVIGNLLDWFLRNSGSRATILVGTSGDTGSAAIHGVLSCDAVDIIVLYPKGRTTLIQELQMVTVDAPNVHVIGVDGTSDDLDVPIRNVFLDGSYCERHHVMSANSINVARILIQTVQFFYAYLRIRPACDGPVSFLIPSGAAGHFTAGMLAKACGLPIGRLVAATNENDILYRFLNSGTFSLSPAVISTTSPSMDINVPYNVERMLWMLSKANSVDVTRWMTEFAEKGSVAVPDAIVSAIREWGLATCRSTMDNVRSTEAETWKASKYLLCPHTAVGAHAAIASDSWGYNATTDGPFALLATAHPAKFADAVLSAIPELTEDEVISSAGPAISDQLRTLKSLPSKAVQYVKNHDWIEDWTAKLRVVIESVSAKWE